jgi:hypothetical protein
LAESEERIFDVMRTQKFKITKDLESMEMEAGSQILEESRRYIQIMGRQFMLESDQDNKEIGTGTSMYQKANAGQVYASMKRS